MIAELLVEVAGTLAIRGVSGTFRDWREDKRFEELPEDHKRTFLELVLAAIFYDGVESSRETAWLDRKRAEGHEAELVDGAVAAVRAALPRAGDDDALVAFAEDRAKLLTEGDSRVEAFEAMAFFLLVGEPPRGNDSPEWALAKRLGAAFGFGESRTLRCLAFASGRTTSTVI